MRTGKSLITGVCCLLGQLVPLHGVSAEHFRLAIANDDDQYIGNILELALTEADGHHTVELIDRVILAQNRALRSLTDEKARYDVHYSGYDPDREQELTMVPFPITLGMLGHRLLAVREEDQNLFAGVQTLDGLRKVAILGSGIDWPDTTVLKSAGLTVATASDNNLWPMLARGRFNAYPRGINEIIPEIESHGSGQHDTGLIIDPHIMLVYRYDHFFFLARDNTHKAAIIEQGMKRALANGKLHHLLDSEPQLHTIMEELRTHPRRIIRLENPNLSDRVRALPPTYWRTYP